MFLLALVLILAVVAFAAWRYFGKEPEADRAPWWKTLGSPEYHQLLANHECTNKRPSFHEQQTNYKHCVTPGHNGKPFFYANPGSKASTGVDHCHDLYRGSWCKKGGPN
jgi:hypothetical protein